MTRSTITVDLEHYNELVKDQGFLEALRQAGVDNWDGYDYAWEIFEENYPEYKE